MAADADGCDPELRSVSPGGLDRASRASDRDRDARFESEARESGGRSRDASEERKPSRVGAGAGSKRRTANDVVALLLEQCPFDSSRKTPLEKAGNHRLARHSRGARPRAEEGALSPRQPFEPRSETRDGMKPSKTATKRRPSKAEEAEPKPSAKKRRRLEGAAAEVDERFQMRPEDEDRETTVDPPETSASKKKKKKKKAEPKGSVDANGSPAPSSKRKKKRLSTEDLEEANEDVTFSDLDDDDDGDDEKNSADARLLDVQKAKRLVLAERAKRKQAKRGVVYLGAIPPRMKPQKLRQLLSPFGKLDRVYLTPEDPGTRLRRKKFGGNTGKNFTEGWVEFLDKKKARSCAEMLNGTQIGGKRRSAHYSDLWMLKYLPKFKWDNLLEEIEYQKAIRDQKMQLELAVAKKERDFYLAKVEQSKQIEAMVRRRVAEGQSGDELNLADDKEETKEEYEKRIAKEKRERKADREMLLRKFKQRQAVGDVNVDDGRGMMAPDVLRDLFAASAEGPKKRAG